MHVQSASPRAIIADQFDFCICDFACTYHIVVYISTEKIGQPLSKSDTTITLQMSDFALLRSSICAYGSELHSGSTMAR